MFTKFVPFCCNATNQMIFFALDLDGGLIFQLCCKSIILIIIGKSNRQRARQLLNAQNEQKNPKSMHSKKIKLKIHIEMTAHTILII